jgi:hypothetical protein
MLRIRALLPLIGYSPIQLLSSLPPTSEFCAMSLRTFADPRVFFYRSSTSNFSIRLSSRSDVPHLCPSPTFILRGCRTLLPRVGEGSFFKGAVFLFRVRGPHRCAFTLSPDKTRVFAASTRSHSERSGRAFSSAVLRPRGHAVEESLIRSVTLKIGIARIPPRVKIHRQRNPTLRICSSQRNLNLNFGR